MNVKRPLWGQTAGYIRDTTEYSEGGGAISAMAASVV